jgi:hypothetical protein
MVTWTFGWVRDRAVSNASASDRSGKMQDCR